MQASVYKAASFGRESLRLMESVNFEFLGEHHEDFPRAWRVGGALCTSRPRKCRGQASALRRELGCHCIRGLPFALDAVRRPLYPFKRRRLSKRSTGYPYHQAPSSAERWKQRRAWPQRLDSIGTQIDSHRV